MKLTPGEFGRAIKRALSTPQSGPGILVTGGASNDVIALAPGFRPAGGFWARVTASTADGTNRWTYTFSEVQKTGAGYTGWSIRSGGRTGTARNTFEDINDAAGIQGNGINIDGSAFPDNFDIQPIPAGTIVWVVRVVRAGSQVAEFWLSYVNAVDGTCDPAAAEAMVIPTAYVATDAAVTSTSSTYADITDWAAATLLDSEVFTFTAGTGLVEAGQGTYRVSYSAAATTSTANSVVKVRAVSKIDAGSFAEVPGTEQIVSLSSLSSTSVRMQGTGYVVVAGGEEVDIKLQIARVSGSGTPTLATGKTFFEVVQVDNA